jgi:hypothetical protein
MRNIIGDNLNLVVREVQNVKQREEIDGECYYWCWNRETVVAKR